MKKRRVLVLTVTTVAVLGIFPIFFCGLCETHKVGKERHRT